MTLRHVLPGVLTAASLLVAATTGLMASYAGVPMDTGSRPILREPSEVLSDGQGSRLARREEEEEKREEIEHEVELNEFARRAELAREETEEEAEEQKKSRSMQDWSVGVVLRAHLEVINERDATSGMAADACVHPVALPPAGRKIEVQLTKRGVNEGDGETVRLQETIKDACKPDGGFYVDESRTPAFVTLCPATCAWAKGAAHGLGVNVLLSGL